MTALKAQAVPNFIRRPDLEEGIILVYGSDAGLVRESARKLVLHYAGGVANSMGVITLDGPELDGEPGLLAVEAKTASLFGERRIVRVRNASKGQVMALTELQDDPGGAIIILEAGNLKPRDALRALIEAAPLGRTLPCFPDSERTIVGLISDAFNKAGIAADADVATTLQSVLGNDREITQRELEKLILFAASSKRLTRQDVLLLCADNAAMILDQIADAAGVGHPEKLDEALSRALRAAVDPQRILFAATAHFSTLRRWRSEVDTGQSARQVLDRVRPKPHFSRTAALEQQLRLWNDSALATACQRLQQATADSRRRPVLALATLRRVLMAISMLAAAR